MHILLPTLEYPPTEGGVARYLESFVRAIPEHNVRVLLPRLWRDAWPRWLPAVWQTIRMVRRDHPHLLVISHVLPFGYPALIVRKLFRIPYLVICHGLDLLAPSDSRWKSWWMKKILKSSASIVTNSNYTASLLSKYEIDPTVARVAYPTSRIFSTVDAARLQSLTDEFGIEGKMVLFSLGRLVARKGIDMAIRSFAEVARERSDVVYLIAGEGPDRDRLARIISEEDLTSCVHLLGFTSSADLAALYTLMDIFVLPTRESKADAEGFGTVFLEAGAFGKPVIAGAGGGVVEAVLHKRTGLVVNPYDLQEITRAMRVLLKDKSLREALGRAGQERVEKEFHTETFGAICLRAIMHATHPV